MTTRPLHAALVLVAMLWLFANSASAMLHPQQGRFMQRDPLGYVDGMGLYCANRANPVVYRDASGRKSWTEEGFEITDLGEREPQGTRVGQVSDWGYDGSVKIKFELTEKEVCPSGFGYKLNLKDWRGHAEFWYVGESVKKGTRDHELAHVAVLREHWADLNRYAQERTKPCYCKSAVASCWIQAVNAKRVAAKAAAAAANWAIDSADYGNDFAHVHGSLEAARNDAKKKEQEFLDQHRKCEAMQ